MKTSTKTTAWQQGYRDSVRGFSYSCPELYNIEQRRAYHRGFIHGEAEQQRAAAAVALLHRAA